MSLNRSEQILYDYVRRHPEERQYIQHKVQSIWAGAPSAEGAVSRIDAELWRYYEERSSVLPEFRDAAPASGPRRISMKNLAEHLVRLWTDPKPRKSPPSGDEAL
jgi:hypothetical protein